MGGGYEEENKPGDRQHVGHVCYGYYGDAGDGVTDNRGDAETFPPVVLQAAPTAAVKIRRSDPKGCVRVQKECSDRAQA